MSTAQQAVFANDDLLTQVLAVLPLADSPAVAATDRRCHALVKDPALLMRTRRLLGATEPMLLVFDTEEAESSDEESDEEESDSEEEDEEEEDDLGKLVSIVKMVDPATGRLRLLPPLPKARMDHGSTMLGQRLVVVGGCDGLYQPSPYVHAFDSTTNQWTELPPLHHARAGAAVAAVNGQLVVVGGWGGGRDYLRSVEVFDPATGAWRERAAMPTARAWAAHGVLSAEGGRLAVVGGMGAADNAEAVAEPQPGMDVYDLAADRWLAVPTAVPAGIAAGCAVPGEGLLALATEAVEQAAQQEAAEGGDEAAPEAVAAVELVVGAQDEPGVEAAAAVEEPDEPEGGAAPTRGSTFQKPKVLSCRADGNWSATELHMDLPLMAGACKVVSLGDGRVVVVGGRQASSEDDGGTVGAAGAAAADETSELGDQAHGMARPVSNVSLAMEEEQPPPAEPEARARDWVLDLTTGLWCDAPWLPEVTATGKCAALRC